MQSWGSIAFDCRSIGLIAFRLHSIDIRLVLVLFDSLSIDSIDDLIPNSTTSVLQVSPTCEGHPQVNATSKYATELENAERKTASSFSD